jgi:serine/threonine protein kinase
MVKVGDIINSRWELIEELSNDSRQGNTFLAIDSHRFYNGPHVVKLLKVQAPEALSRFEKEIRACLALRHPNIVKVVDSAYENAPTPYLVTEYCSGRALTAEKIGNLPTIERLRMCFVALAIMTGSFLVRRTTTAISLRSTASVFTNHRLSYLHGFYSEGVGDAVTSSSFD